MTDNVKKIIDLIGSTYIVSLFHDSLNKKMFEDDNYIYYTSENKLYTTFIFENIILDYIYLAMMKFNINKQLAILFPVQGFSDASYYKEHGVKIVSHNDIDYILKVYDNYVIHVDDNSIESRALRLDLPTTLRRYIGASIDEFKDVELFIKVLKLYKSYIDFKLLLSDEGIDLTYIEGEYKSALIRFIKDNNIIIDMEDDIKLWPILKE